MRDQLEIIKKIMEMSLPSKVYEVYEFGWYYYNFKAVFATKQEALNFIGLTEEEYNQKHEEYSKRYSHSAQGCGTILTIEEINVNEFLQEYYNTVIKEVKENTIHEEAQKIKEESEKEINFTIKRKVENTFSDFFQKMIKLVYDEYGIKPNFDAVFRYKG